MKYVSSLPPKWEDTSNEDVCLISLHFLLLNFARGLVAYYCYILLARAHRPQCLARPRRRLARRRQRMAQRRRRLNRSNLVRPWTLVCILITLLLMDADTEVDARTGVPMEEGAGAWLTLQDAIMDNKDIKETIILLFQYARQEPRATAYLLHVKTNICFSSTFMNNILLVVHFLVAP